MIEVIFGQPDTGFWSPALLAAAINASVAIATATVVGYFAWRQARTARDKLALDLFGERFKAWKSLEATFSDYAEKASRRYVDRDDSALDPDEIRKWITAESDVAWLFGDEVFQRARRVGSLLASLADCPIDDADKAEPRERSKRFEAEIAVPAYVAFADLRTSMGPYMMLDKIAVNRPVGPFRWPWARDHNGGRSPRRIRAPDFSGPL